MANKFTILNLRELCFDSELSDNTQSQPISTPVKSKPACRSEAMGFAGDRPVGLASTV